MFSFDGDFSGAYRDIPLRDGESLDQVSVVGGRQPYRPGGCAELGCRARPGRSGRTRTTRASGSSGTTAPRTRSGRSAIHYRLRGLAVAYDDVVDVNLQVWGDEWEVGLDQLTAAMIAPGDVLRAWGHPVGVRGDVTIDGPRVDLRAERIPAASSSSCARVVPRRFFTSTAGMQVVDGLGLRRSWPRSARTQPRSSATSARSTTRSTTSARRSRSCSRSRSSLRSP